MRDSTLFLGILSVTFGISWIEASRILVIYPAPSPSHYILGLRIIKELAARGHEVSVISPFPRNPPENFRDISVESVIDFVVRNNNRVMFDLENLTVFEHGKFITDLVFEITEQVLIHENVQDLLKSNEQFDLLLLPQYASEAFLALAHRFNAPVILITTMPLYAWGSFNLAHPSPPSYVPNLFSPFTGEMTFWQRFTNTFYDLENILYNRLVILPKHREIAKKNIPGHPDLYDYLHNFSLVLVNSHVSIYDPVPYAPNVIEIGGFHVSPPQELPQDIKQFMEDSKDGVILFSMGSNLQSSSFPPQKRDAFLQAFTKLKQNVLWKFETEDIGKTLPKNVKIKKWLPQQDILAHPNTRAFISHGGLLSTTEAVHHGVPIIGIPVFVDQKMNMASATNKGYGILLPYPELTEERLSLAINEILNNPKYKENIKKRSKILLDRPMKPLDTAIYWIEYVIRHNGAHHLKHGGLKLAWYQLYLLDVAAVVIFMIMILVGIVYCIIRRIVFFSKPSKVKTK